MSLITLVLYMVVAVVCAHLASKVMSHSNGSTSAVLAGILGAYLGSNYVSAFGPSFEGVSILPAMAGSAVLILTVSYLGRYIHKGA